MKANELRVGNWVKGPLGELCKVTQLGHEKYSEYIGAKGDGFFGQNGFEPIPLTPEILVKAGFEWSIYHQGFYKQDFVFVLHEYEDGFRFKLFRSSQYLGVKINHLHQLQNLYFALTGKELTFDL
jgi:hypothetical protein